jgi:DNA-binding response OmpR family regulator
MSVLVLSSDADLRSLLTFALVANGIAAQAIEPSAERVDLEALGAPVLAVLHAATATELEYILARAMPMLDRGSVLVLCDPGQAMARARALIPQAVAYLATPVSVRALIRQVQRHAAETGVTGYCVGESLTN